MTELTTLDYGCVKCNDRDHRRSALEQIGEPAKETYFSGKAQETQTPYRCKFCGTKWINYIESGVGGHGNSWAPTK
jgi:hypothetical protein